MTRPEPGHTCTIRQGQAHKSLHHKKRQEPFEPAPIDRPKPNGAYTIGQGRSPTEPTAQDKVVALLSSHHKTRTELYEPVTQDKAGAYLSLNYKTRLMPTEPATLNKAGHHRACKNKAGARLSLPLAGTTGQGRSIGEHAAKIKTWAF
jgi:hypothetical protein